MSVSSAKRWSTWVAIIVMLATTIGAQAEEQSTKVNYLLGAGDAIRINVFKHPDMTLETRVSESGTITFPLIGSMDIGGLSLSSAGEKLASALNRGGFVRDPQVNITLLEVRGNQVSVLGQVNRPGRFPLETFNTRLSDVLAMAGGISSTGSDVVIVTGTRDGLPFRSEIDFPAIFTGSDTGQNILVAGGDVVYVDRAPVFYIYGEVQRPGAYRIEREMTVQQALAQGGGVNVRGTEKGIKVHRKDAEGEMKMITSYGYDLVRPDDVIYIRESLF